MSDANSKLALRVHDEVISLHWSLAGRILLTGDLQCNGSDVFGSDICTCRPYLIFGIEEAVKEAQNGGSGVVIYFRKEGRALGEVTKVRTCITTRSPNSDDLCANVWQYREFVWLSNLRNKPLTIFDSCIQREKTRRGSRLGLFQANRKCSWREGYALPSPYARYPALARHKEDWQDAKYEQVSHTSRTRGNNVLDAKTAPCSMKHDAIVGQG